MIEHMQLGDMPKFCEDVVERPLRRAAYQRDLSKQRQKGQSERRAAQYEIAKDENGFLVSRKI